MSVVLVTGAANGIGLALTEVLLKQRATVIMVDKDQSLLSAKYQKLIALYPKKVFFFCADICSDKSVVDLYNYFKSLSLPLDYIYNNAGIIGPLAPVWEIPLVKINQVMQVNLYGMMRIIQTFIPFLFQQNFESRIINMASLYALCAGAQNSAYSISKHAVLALSESLHADLQLLEKNVQISVCFPSFTATQLLQTKDNPSKFQEKLGDLLSHSKPALDVAQHIVEAVKQNLFYIFPDKEVKEYCSSRVEAMIEQQTPHKNNVEKMLNTLYRRSQDI